MNSGTLRRLGALALLLCAAFAGPAAADLPDHWTLIATVPAGLNPDDLHITLTGTGGSITKEILARPAGTVTVTGGNTLNVTLSSKAIPGTQIALTFSTNTTSIGFSSGTWTNGGSTIGAVSSGDVQIASSVPGVTTGALIALTLLLVGAGAFAIRRRRAELA